MNIERKAKEDDYSSRPFAYLSPNEGTSTPFVCQSIVKGRKGKDSRLRREKKGSPSRVDFDENACEQSGPDEEGERETGTRLGEVFVNSPFNRARAHKARARAQECIFSHRQWYLKINETLRHTTVFRLGVR